MKPRKNPKERYNLDILLQFIKLANLIPASARLPEPQALEPTGRDRVMLEKFFAKFLGLFPKMSFREFSQRYPEGEDEKGHRVCWEGFFLNLDTRSSRRTRPQGWVWKGPLSWQLQIYGPPSMIPDKKRPQAVYGLFYAVRTALAALVESKSAGMVNLWTSTLKRAHWEAGGIIRVEPDAYHDGFIRALENAEIERIKHCPICGAFFWAKPKNKGACSPKCLNLNRVRNWREKQSRYEANRRINKRARSSSMGEALKLERERATTRSSKNS
jgi:predicted nucleic acid-binding Zn ribbon protein